MDFITKILLEGGGFKGFGDPIVMTVIMVGFVAFFYFFVIRPQGKKKKEMQNMLDSIKKGDKVVTIGGVHGKVSAVKEGEIVLRVDSNAEITFEKAAIAKVVKAVNTEEEEKDVKKDKKDK